MPSELARALSNSLPAQIVLAALLGIAVGAALPPAPPEAKSPPPKMAPPKMAPPKLAPPKMAPPAVPVVRPAPPEPLAEPSAAQSSAYDIRTPVLTVSRVLAEGFIRLIKMVIAPLLLCVITVGIAGMGDAKSVGRVGGKAILYFEIITTVALLMGLIAVNVIRPGDGMVVDAGSPGGGLSAERLAKLRQQADSHSTADFLLSVVPENIVESLAHGNLLQVLFFSVLLGLALSAMGPEKSRPVVTAMKATADALLHVVALVVRLSPLGVAGAMCRTVGEQGVASLTSLALLMAVCYGTMIVFVVGVLGGVLAAIGVSLRRLLHHIRDEIVLVLGMSSSEAALPKLMEKMESFGCPKSVVGLVVPTGYSFNLDGTSIYLTIAAVFIAQAYGIELSWREQLGLLAVLMLTSKGSAAVTGGGFVTLAATLEATHTVPVEGLALLLGVDRFLSEARATVNLIGNAVACVVVSHWEGQFPDPAAQPILLNEPDVAGAAASAELEKEPRS